MNRKVLQSDNNNPLLLVAGGNSNICFDFDPRTLGEDQSQPILTNCAYVFQDGLGLVNQPPTEDMIFFKEGSLSRSQLGAPLVW